nr:hypothetical protein [Methylosinus sp. Sm6]
MRHIDRPEPVADVDVIDADGVHVLASGWWKAVKTGRLLLIFQAAALRSLDARTERGIGFELRLSRGAQEISLPSASNHSGHSSQTRTPRAAAMAMFARRWGLKSAQYIDWRERPTVRPTAARLDL